MEYKRIKDDIPAVLQPPMKPFCDRVEEALLPGVTALTWTALNVDTCKKIYSIFPAVLKIAKNLFSSKLFVLIIASHVII
jgi:hypothetical protein